MDGNKGPLNFFGLTPSKSQNELNDSSPLQFIYHNQTISRSAIDTNNPDLVMAIGENNTVYVFDNNDEFMNWSATTKYATDVAKLESKRQDILSYAQANGVIEQYENTGILKQDYIDYINTKYPQTANKTNVLTALYDLKNAPSGTDFYVIILSWPYGTIGKMDNRASSISGITVVTACYDKTYWSGSRVYVLCAGATINFSDLGFDNKTSSVLAL